MRQYLYIFWTMVIAGMLLLTAAYPESRNAIMGSDDVPRYVYDSDGSRTLLSACSF